jgi:hypothetical protein
MEIELIFYDDESRLPRLCPEKSIFLSARKTVRPGAIFLLLFRVKIFAL